MSDTAAASVNPNVTVGAESTVTSRANSAISFDQIDAADAPAPKETKPRAEKKPEPKAEPKPEPKEEREVKPAGKDKADAEPEEKDGKPAKAEPKAKPKVHKFKVGEEVRDLPGDAVIEVPVDGKNEEVTLEDLRSSYSGKQYYTRKLGELGKKEDAHNKQVSSLNDMSTKLLKQAKDDPEAAWDFLAELTGQDPVEIKGNLFREQVKMARQLANLTDEQVEGILKEKTLDWRDRKLKRREESDKEAVTRREKEATLTSVREKYGLDEGRYDHASKLAGQYLKSQGQEREPTSEEVVYTDRFLMAERVIKETVPELVNHGKFRDIFNDVVSDLVRTPSMTPEQLGKALRATFGSTEDSGRKRLSQKVRDRTDADDESTTSRRPKKEAIRFEDL
jgi:hypothetical protein